MTFSFFLFLAACLILVKSSHILIRSLCKIADFFKISEFSLGFMLMALATSLPEIFVSITAALEGLPTLALGNVLGSNIADLTLVAGIGVLAARGLWVKKIIAEQDALYMLLCALAPVFLLADLTLSRGDGLFLLLLYGFYVLTLSRRGTSRGSVEEVKKVELWQNLFYFAVALIFLLASSALLVDSAQNLAQLISIPISLIGLFAVALGTSLPELTFELEAVAEHGGFVLGDLFGSVVANSTLALGLAAIISPFQIQSLSLYLSTTVFLIVTLLLFVIFIRTDRKLEVPEGLILLFLYIFFLLTEFGVEFFVTR